MTVRCQTITACSATGTTTTTTIDEEEVTETISLLNYVMSVDPGQWSAYAAEILAVQSAWIEDDRPITTATRTTITQPDPTATPVDFSCKGSPLCGNTFFDLAAFCDQAKAYLTEETIYGYVYIRNKCLCFMPFHDQQTNNPTRTTDEHPVEGTCYTDGINLTLGCGVFVEGHNCEMTGNQMGA
jgi:chitinase